MADTQQSPKNIVIVGAGLAGVTAAYSLARRSVQANVPCHIRVVEARSQVALETSFANAGRFCPSSLALGSPAQGAGVRRTFIPNWLLDTFLFQQDVVDQQQPNIRHMQVDFFRRSVWYWGFANLFLKDKEKSARGHELLAKQSVASMQRNLASLPAQRVEDLAIRRGTLYLYNDEEDFQRIGVAKANRINSFDLYSAEVMNTERALTLFPWLASWKQNAHATLSRRVPGVINATQDWSADARKFALAIAEAAQNLGPDVSVEFEFETAVDRICDGGVEVDSVRDGRKCLPADVVVIACGRWSNGFFVNGEKRLPIEGLRGFSVDLYDCKGMELPTVTLVDFSSGDLNFQITPYEDGRIRIVGFADFVGPEGKQAACEDTSDGAPTAVLTSHMRFLFPSLTWSHQRATWSGLRPMTPDNLPYVGQATKLLENQQTGRTQVFLCCGHGAQGWTSSSATADILARLVLPIPGEEIDDETRELIEALHPERFI